MLETTKITCPYCGEPLELALDNSAGDQQYIEDCSVCCRPIELATEFDSSGNLVSITAKRDDD